MSKAQSEPEEARLGRLGRREAEEEEHDGGGARPGQAPQVRQDRVRLLEARRPGAGLLQGECGHGDVCLAGNLNPPHCIALQVGIEEDVVDIVYRYWILKRKAGGNKPLMMARTEQALLLANEKSLETDKEKMKRFISLRQVRFSNIMLQRSSEILEGP